MALSVEVLMGSDGRGLCVDVPLSFLSEQATGAYLADRFGFAREDPVCRRLAQTVHRRTDGNPLFMVNVVDELCGHGVIARDAGVWRVVGDVEPLGAGVPEGLKPLIDRQLERLPAEAQRLLEAASVAGRVFSAETVAAALETTLDGIDERCDRLNRGGIFVAETADADGHYTFLHDLYQHALYDRLSASRRARLHRRIAEFDLTAPDAQVRDRAAQLAVHFERAGDPARAIAHLHQAATNALKRQAFQEAIDVLQHALGLLASLPATSARDESELGVQMLLSQPLMLAKGYGVPEVAAAATRARQLSERLERSPALVPALLGMVRLHSARGEYGDAAALGEQMADLARHAPDPLPLVADSVMAYVHYFRGELEAARMHAERGAAAHDLVRHRSVALAYGDDPGVGCLAFGALAAWALGYPEQARVRVAAALALARRIEIPHCEAYALFFFCWVHLSARKLTAVCASLDALDALAARHVLPQSMARASEMRGWLLVQEGRDPAAAAQLLQQGLAGQARTGVLATTPWFMAIRAEALAAAGETRAARAAIDEAIAVSGSMGESMSHMLALTAKGDLCAAASELDEAATCFDEAIAIAQRQSAKSRELRAATRLARLRQRQGHVAEARALLGAAYDWFTEGFDMPDLCDARALLESLSSSSRRS